MSKISKSTRSFMKRVRRELNMTPEVIGYTGKSHVKVKVGHVVASISMTPSCPFWEKKALADLRRSLRSGRGEMSHA